jgi:hypothetical protein
MPRRYDLSNERELTNEEFAAEIATKTGLTADEIARLLPKKADKERLDELITIVNSAASDNKKLADLRKNFSESSPFLVETLHGSWLITRLSSSTFSC